MFGLNAEVGFRFGERLGELSFRYIGQFGGESHYLFGFDPNAIALIEQNTTRNDFTWIYRRRQSLPVGMIDAGLGPRYLILSHRLEAQSPHLERIMRTGFDGAGPHAVLALTMGRAIQARFGVESSVLMGTARQSGHDGVFAGWSGGPPGHAFRTRESQEWEDLPTLGPRTLQGFGGYSQSASRVVPTLACELSFRAASDDFRFADFGVSIRFERFWNVGSVGNSTFHLNLLTFGFLLERRY